jgi:hypothetical protein
LQDGATPKTQRRPTQRAPDSDRPHFFELFLGFGGIRFEGESTIPVGRKGTGENGWRFLMNTKLIIVDGHSSVGKSSISKSVYQQIILSHDAY